MRVRSALQQIFPRSKRLQRFDSCGDAAWVFRSRTNPDRLKVCSDTCRDRWCRACQRDRARIIAANLRTHLIDQEVKLITLTLRHHDQPLRHQVDRLIDAFRTLRKKPIWTGSITGGVGFIEVKWQRATDRWHPHLHVLCLGAWIHQGDLSETWRQITTDSFNVDVRLVRDLARVAYYVVKYASKPIDVALYRNPARLREAVLALQGRHLCMTFGSFRGWKLTQQDQGTDWDLIGSLDYFHARAAEGDVDALHVLQVLRAASGFELEVRKPP